MATPKWVDWFNTYRLLGPIGLIPPAEAQANRFAAKQDLDMAA
jgi:putative transposase